MAVLTGNYITLHKGGPGFITSGSEVDFVLARSVDTTDFRTAADYKRVASIDGQTAKCITFRLTGDKAKNAKPLLSSIGVDRQYDVHGRIPKYKALNGVPSPATKQLGDTELEFTPIEIGVKPDYWDDAISRGHIFRFVGAEGVPYTTDGGKWRMVVSPEWNASMQYYYCPDAGCWYSLVSANPETPKEDFLMFYLGRGILNARDSSRISEYVLQTPLTTLGSEDNNFGWWMYGTWVEQEPVVTQLTPTGGYTELSQASVYATNSLSYFDNLYNGWRNVGSTLGAWYASGWKIDGDAKTAWKNNCEQTVEIQNLTITQFGTLTDDGHTYFGVWVVEPEIKNFVGYNRVPGANNDIATVSSNDIWIDLRDYGTFGETASRTDFDYSRVTFYGLEITELNIVPPIKDGPVPPPVNPYVPSGKDWPKLDPTYLRGRQTGLLADYDKSGFHIYRGTKAALDELQGDLWNWGEVWTNIGKQIEDGGNFNPLLLLVAGVQGVLSSAQESKVDPLAAIQFIHNLPGFCNDWSGTLSTIKVAGIDTGISAYCINQDVIYKKITISCEELASTQSYLDLSPWSTAEIYLPYIGTIQIDPADIIGGYIDIHYNCCITSGVISAQLVCYNALAPGYATEYGPYIGDAKYSIPIAQKDQNAFNRELGYVKAMGTAMGGVVAGLGNSIKTLTSANTIGDVVSGGLRTNAIMGAGSLLSAKQFIDSYLMKQQFRGTELGSGSAIVSPTQSIYIMYSTPLPVYSDFSDCSRRGLTSGKLTTVASAKQSNQRTLVKFNYIDLNNSGLSKATQAELDAIQTYMLGGVYI